MAERGLDLQKKVKYGLVGALLGSATLSGSVFASEEHNPGKAALGRVTPTPAMSVLEQYREVEATRLALTYTPTSTATAAPEIKVVFPSTGEDLDLKLEATSTPTVTRTLRPTQTPTVTQTLQPTRIPSPTATETSNPSPTPIPEPEPWTANAKISGYCDRGPTRSGPPAGPGIVSVDPNFIPLGSKLDIDTLGSDYIALDTGGVVRGWHVDVWMSSCRDAINWGIQYRNIKVTRWGHGAIRDNLLAFWRGLGA